MRDAPRPRSVLVHGLSYGNDSTPIKLFLKDLDPAVTRGVAVIGAETSHAELQNLHDQGVRGIRLDFYSAGAMHNLEKQKEMLQYYADRIRPFGWSMGFLQLEPKNWESLAEIIPSLGVNVIVDHHALMKAPSMLAEGEDVMEQIGFRAILGLLAKADNFWVKLSAPYRCSSQTPGYDDMHALVRAFLDAKPKRLIWGSDWPHTPRMLLRSPEEAMKEVSFLEIDDAACCPGGFC